MSPINWEKGKQTAFGEPNGSSGWGNRHDQPIGEMTRSTDFMGGKGQLLRQWEKSTDCGFLIFIDRMTCLNFMEQRWHTCSTRICIIICYLSFVVYFVIYNACTTRVKCVHNEGKMTEQCSAFARSAYAYLRFF